jgi:hypothetical protein
MVLVYIRSRRLHEKGCFNSACFWVHLSDCWSRFLLLMFTKSLQNTEYWDNCTQFLTLAPYSKLGGASTATNKPNNRVGHNRISNNPCLHLVLHTCILEQEKT